MFGNRIDHALGFADIGLVVINGVGKIRCEISDASSNRFSRWARHGSDALRRPE
jgi:hypothetical protein